MSESRYKDGKVAMSLRVKPETRRELNILAAKRETTVGAILTRAIADILRPAVEDA